jgi:hypothetical protein
LLIHPASKRFDGTFDNIICAALIQERDADIGLSPGFRWGTTVLPGSPIHNVTAITAPRLAASRRGGGNPFSIQTTGGESRSRIVKLASGSATCFEYEAWPRGRRMLHIGLFPMICGDISGGVARRRFPH